MQSMRGPWEFCRALNLHPTEYQVRLLEQFRAGPNPLDVVQDEGGEALRAVLTFLAWWTLAERGRRASILAPADPGQVLGGDLALRASEYLVRLVFHTSPALASTALPRRWNHIGFGGEPGWELRIVPCVPKIAAEAGERSGLVVVLGAGGSETAFAEAREALEAASTARDGRLIRLW